MRYFIFCLLLLSLAAMPALRADEPAGGTESAEDAEAPSLYIDGVIVVVNEDVVTLGELNQEILRMMHMMRDPSAVDESALRDVALRSLINEKLLAQYAEKEKIEIDETKIDEMVNERVEEFGGEPALIKAVFPLQAITREGLTIEDVKKEFRSQQKIQELVRRKTSAGIYVTPNKMRDYYEAHKGAWALPERARFREIEIIYLPKDSEYKPGNYREFENAAAAKKFAEELLAEINTGKKEFDKAAMTASMNPWHEDGGLRTLIDGSEWHTRDDLKKFMTDFLFDPKTVAGQVSGVIEGDKKDNGEISYFILKLEERQPAATLSFEEAQREIIDRIVAEERGKRRDALLAEIYKDAFIYPEKFRNYNE